MSNSDAIPLPASHAIRKLGRDLRSARLKRRISTEDMTARINASRATLWRLERGDPTVSLGVLATALFVLQLHDRLANVASANTDELGLQLVADQLPQRIRRRHK